VAIAVAGFPDARGVDLLRENFDGLTLGPVVTFESELRSRKAWTQTSLPAPFGTEVWSLDNALVPEVNNPNVGVAEFKGWSFVDRDWWVQTAGDQQRSQFVSASGTIAVADPDEWDDFSATSAPASFGDFDAKLLVSNINLTPAGSQPINLFFHSSWRPEDTQKASLTVRYNDPAATQVTLLNWTSDENDANYKPDAVNEAVNLPLQKPAGATAANLEFRVYQARNDWWWAIDNVTMYTGDAPSADGALRLVINRDSGAVSIVNNTGKTVNLRGYTIESRFGTLIESAANYLGESSSSWQILDRPNSSELSEGHYSSFAFPAISANPTQGRINLGPAWRSYHQDISDISFQYLSSSGTGPQVGIVEFQGNGGRSFEFLDLNYDGAVNIGDYAKFLDGYGSTSLTGKLLAERHNLGDLNDDGRFSVLDFLEFKRRFDEIRGAGAFAAMLAAVPEPTAAGLLLAAGLAACVHRRRARTVLAALLLAAASAGDAQAQLLLYNEDFESVPLGPSPEEDPAQLNVWAESYTGWTIDDSGMPGIGNPANDGVTDWAGWAFVKKSFWLDADDQTRSQFSRASGTIFVADPDEWEDAPVLPNTPRPLSDFYDARAKTPVITIPAGIPNGKIRLAFDSSWRPEGQDDGAVNNLNNQTASVSISYNGGAQTQIINWGSDPLAANFKPDAQNEAINLALPNHNNATNVQLQFDLGVAWNDWWWAIDNLRIFVPADPSILRIDLGDGTADLIGGDVIPASINAIDIQSAKGSLNPAAGIGLSNSKPDAIGPGLGDSWQLAAANENFFSEFFLDGSSVFTSARTFDLGRIFDVTTLETDRDVKFTYTTAFGDVIEGIVQYVGTPPTFETADFNKDSAVDGRDLLIWQRGFGLTAQNSNDNGDADRNGVVNGADQAVWATQYGFGAASAAAQAVPEPAAAALLAAGGALCLALRRRVRQALPVVLLATAAAAAARAQGPPALDRDYKFGESDPGAANNVTIAFNGTTRDDAGVGPASTQQIVLLTAKSRFFVNPKYETVTGRPDGGTGLGIRLDANLQQYLDTPPQLALNLPIRSPSSLQSDFGQGSIDYSYITDRGFQLWTKPAALPLGASDAHIVMDSNNHGVLIKNNGRFAMRYNNADYLASYADLPGTTLDNGLTFAQPGTWYHLSVVRPFGAARGSILYVNGIAVAAATGTYLGEQDLAGDEVLPPTAIDDAPLTVGTNTSEGADHAGRNFYSGLVDDLKMFVMGFNRTRDFGEYLFQRDNAYAAFFAPKKDGDLDGDLDVDQNDVLAFANNWLFEKRLSWSTGSLRVGDLSTRALGDFNYDGRIDLKDWDILNKANPTMGSAALALIGSIPEPSGVVLALAAVLSPAYRRRRACA
jgi:hypothetical protein